MTDPFPDSRPLAAEDLQPIGWNIYGSSQPGAEPYAFIAVSDLVTWQVSHFPCRGRGHRWHRIRWFLRHPVLSWR